MASCSDIRKSELQVFDLVDLSRPETVFLSSVCEEILYIPLEKGDRILGSIMDVKYSAGIYAIQSGSMISVFDEVGRLKFILDRQGRDQKYRLAILPLALNISVWKPEKNSC